MKRPHLLRVEEGPDVFAPLLSAMAAEGLRSGWLELAEPEPLPPTLTRAATAGVLRAVAVGESGSVAVKRRRGAPVLDDLLREHFRGCRLVLVRGKLASTRAEGQPQLDLARLIPASGGSWQVEPTGAAARSLSTEELVARLRRVRPWGADSGKRGAAEHFGERSGREESG